MKIGQALAIFMYIENGEYTISEKCEAIRKVLEMPTHNGVTKEMMMKVIKWLYDQLNMKDGDGE